MPKVIVKNGEVLAGGSSFGKLEQLGVREPRQRRPFPELPVGEQLVENLSENRQVEVTFFQQHMDSLDAKIARRRKSRVGRGGDRTKLMIGDRRQPL